MSGFWQDEESPAVYRVPEAVQDLVFRIECRALPVDHALALHRALTGALPWLAREPGAGIHLIHGAESGNGWQRPEAGSGQLLHLSRRARMSLRLPRERLAEAGSLSGERLRIGDHELAVGRASARPLSEITTLFARYVQCPLDRGDESGFLEWARDGLAAIGVRAPKMLAGRSHRLRLADGDVETRSLMLAGLEVSESVRVQEQGLGPGRLFGCGLFLPHKSIEPVAGARAARRGR